MKLGLFGDCYSQARVDIPIARVRHAERLGFDSVWTAEATLHAQQDEALDLLTDARRGRS